MEFYKHAGLGALYSGPRLTFWRLEQMRRVDGAGALWPAKSQVKHLLELDDGKLPRSA